jgi:hypothetical protein
VNGIIAGLEFLANALVPGTPFEFGRLQGDLVLEAYDKMKEDLKTAGMDSKKIKTASTEFIENVSNSFLTKSEYDKVREIAFQNNSSMLEALNFIKGDTDNFSKFVSDASGIAKSATNSAMSAVTDLMNYIKDKANGLNSGGKSSSSSSKSVSISSLSGLEGSTKNPASVLKEEAKKGTYNTNLNFTQRVFGVIQGNQNLGAYSSVGK